MDTNGNNYPSAPAATQGSPRHLPWIVLGAASWLGAICESLRFLTTVPVWLLGATSLIGAPGIAALAIACLPLSPFKNELVRFTKNWFVCVAAYTLVVAATVFILLLGCSAVGYLPYSDRPGPGWGNVPAHVPSIEEIQYFGSWTIYLVPMCAFWGSFIFFFGAWATWFRTPRWLVRVLGILFCGFLALLATEAAGWYIAIAAFPVYGAGAAGSLFGGLVLPRFCGGTGSRIALWKASVLVLGAATMVAALLTYPLWRSRI
jgi:hypothetical protein